ncbi:glycosyltransferase [Metabacillus dongyingensis]|uniref:glycosyltransferase n=1 Tax=Metabacillus dongyingensis TaxID=2874282 RepID=UPI001CC18383|nr:glycosyltransferase [Metabacillus dongyingensis]UAL50263.1 glycosyltransferase [Metabacillus dongyingensis]
MKRKILISMYSLNIGGAERSLIGLLESINYNKFEVDLFLYRHEGEFIKFLPNEVNLLPEIKQYSTFERPIKDIILEGHIYLGMARVLAKLKAKIKNRGVKKDQKTYKQMQYVWHYSMLMLPHLKEVYDVGISFLGPHNFMVQKVFAKVKLGWNHTDYFTTVNPDIKMDERIWQGLDCIVNVSKDCEGSFLKVFPNLSHKTTFLENIISPTFVKEQSKLNSGNEMPNEDIFKICSVGRFSKAKGFDMAVLACKNLVELGINIKWYIVGYGGEEENIRKLVKKYNLEDKFILLGKKINPYPYIKRCDIYCQPSRYEGKAVTVREAQILGKPVLITNYPTAKSQLDNGFDGVICELSIQGIVDGIRKLYMDSKLRDELSKNCLKNDYGNMAEVNKLYNLIDQYEKSFDKKVIV